MTTTLCFQSNEHHGLLDVPASGCELRVHIRDHEEGYAIDAEAVELSTGQSDAWYAYLEFVCDPLAFAAIGASVPDCAWFVGNCQWVFTELPDAIHWAKRFAIDGLGVSEASSFIYTNWSDGITPKQCGASQLACNIVNETFLSLDGFASMRRQMSDTTYTAEQFAGELARIVDREIGKLAPPPVFRITAIRRTSVFGSCSLFATFDGGEERLLFSYYLDELAFSDDELIGLTEDEAHQLRQQKDVAYLRT